MDRLTSMRTLGGLLLLTSLTALAPTYGAGLNTDVALTPPEDGTILRAQWRYSRLGDDPTPLRRDVDLSIQPVTAVHGFTSDFTMLATTPVVHQEVELGRANRQLNRTGVADIPLLAKYRFFQKDEPGRTTRWAALGGAELPTFDEPFSSDSLDPIVGTVWTCQQRDWWVDWDVIYQLNTAGGLRGEDELRADVAYSHRLVGGNAEGVGPWALYGVAELNSTYLTDGSTEVLASPGIQLIFPQWVFEAGVQLPVHQDLSAPRLERDFTTVLSVRFQF